MNSRQVKAHFAASGLNVRVRDLGGKFRICGVTTAVRELVIELAADLGLTDVLGGRGGQWNSSSEFVAYKPGQVVRV